MIRFAYLIKFDNVIQYFYFCEKKIKFHDSDVRDVF